MEGTYVGDKLPCPARVLTELLDDTGFVQLLGSLLEAPVEEPELVELEPTGEHADLVQLVLDDEVAQLDHNAEAGVEAANLDLAPAAVDEF